MNSLLEMTHGQTTVDHFVSSKPEGGEQLESNGEGGVGVGGMGGGGGGGGMRNHSAHHHGGSSHHAGSNHHGGGGGSNAAAAFSNVFYEASMQRTSNFRAGIAYNPAPVKLEKPKPAASPVKPKSNMSTFKMIAISEESRMSSYPSKRVSFRPKKNSISNSRASETPKKSPSRK